MVTAVINAELTKPDEGQDAQILKDTPHQAILGENTDEEQFPFKGFSDNLIGMAKGEEKEFTHKYPKGFRFRTSARQRSQIQGPLGNRQEIDQTEIG